ncbi:MAG: hypothetical protein HQ582_28465 [Planctomycetes bacterium]|nr:hypothetical protein [Planctomycetota bacterium]
MSEKRKHRWFQFSLRTLLVFVLLVSIGMSWLGVQLDRARKQREAVEAIEKAGGSVLYGYELTPSGSSVPMWLRELLGEDFFFDVSGVVGARHDFGDAGLEHLNGLTSLQGLYLDDMQVTDAGLEHLKGLTSLQRLDLEDTQVTDAGLEHLKGLTSLLELDLNDTQVTDAGLEHLKGLTNLVALELVDTQVTPEGVESLKRALPNCYIDCEPQP